MTYRITRTCVPGDGSPLSSITMPVIDAAARAANVGVFELLSV